MLETEPVSHPPTSHSITNQRPKHPPRDVKLNRRFQMGTTTLENLKKKGEQGRRHQVGVESRSRTHKTHTNTRTRAQAHTHSHGNLSRLICKIQTLKVKSIHLSIKSIPNSNNSENQNVLTVKSTVASNCYVKYCGPEREWGRETRKKGAYRRRRAQPAN